MKRNVLLEWFDKGKNKQLTKAKCFNIILGKVNYVVDDNQLTTQLTQAMEYADRKIINENPSKGKKHHTSNTNYNSRNSLNQSPLLTIHNLLSNLSITSWTSFLSQNFSKSPNTIRLLQLQNSYMNVSIMNYYRIKYSQLPQLLYKDMKDFDKMLNKFNFLRFFMTSGNDNVLRAQKNCYLLIKNIQWRTQQSQQYLLLLLRNNSWERVCITVHNFCILYQTVNNNNILLKQKQSKLNGN